MNCKPVYTLKETELIGVEAPQDMIELALCSLRVKNENPVKLILCAEPESAKTQLMLKYRENSGVFVIRRFTAFGLVRDIRQRIIKPLFPHLKILGTIYLRLLSPFHFQSEHN